MTERQAMTVRTAAEVRADVGPRIAATVARIGALDEGAMGAARERQDRLTKPQGSLGRLEELSVRIAGMTGRALPAVGAKAVIVMAADHGVTAEGVSAYPSEVTAQMVANFLAGGAAINVLARAAGARVVVVDMGVAADVPADARLRSRPIARGTRNMAAGPAMTRDEARRAVEAGIDVLDEEAAAGLALVATGDMGIGNTTAASAVVAALSGAPAAAVTGRGTGVDDATYERKVRVVERALEVNRPDPRDPLGVLAAVGGFEIAGLAGVVLGAAARRIPVVVDGFISGAAALAAAALAPAAAGYMIAGHRSVEPGHRVLLERLGLEPLLDLGMRLGEGTGAVIAMTVVDAALRVLAEMATFGEAGVSEREAM